MNNSVLSKYFSTEQELTQWSREIAMHITNPIAIGISGEIGMGKTTFCRALLKALGVTEVIRSPTFTWLETYNTTQGLVHHIDLYRLEDETQYYRLNLEEYVGHDLLLIEWPLKSQKVLSWLDVHGKLKISGTGRIIELQALSALGKKFLGQIQGL